MYFAGIFDLLDDEIAVHGLGYACDGLPTLPVGEKAIIGVVQPRDVDGLLPLPIEENAKIIDSDKYELLIVCVHLRRPKHTFLPACRGKVSFCALAMDFSPCLPRKRDYLFAERQGGNSIVSTHQIHLVRLHAELFLDRKRAKSIASTRQVHEQRSLGITFLLRGRRESPSQAHAKSMTGKP